ncbi:hypothetical protein C8R43DRAFT_1036127 [Mycena crocata]|nr:hypothetical protein C8R43DRAFT_1036127 [Mycena crocata]
MRRALLFPLTIIPLPRFSLIPVASEQHTPCRIARTNRVESGGHLHPRRSISIESCRIAHRVGAVCRGGGVVHRVDLAGVVFLSRVVICADSFARIVLCGRGRCGESALRCPA